MAPWIRLCECFRLKGSCEVWLHLLVMRAFFFFFKSAISHGSPNECLAFCPGHLPLVYISETLSPFCGFLYQPVGFPCSPGCGVSRDPGMEVFCLESYATYSSQVLLSEAWGPLLEEGNILDCSRIYVVSQPSQRFEQQSEASHFSLGRSP